jgi:energy-coupling factor transport system ATP-binding protein
MSTVLDINKYSYRYPENDAFLFQDICMTIKPGECHCITGPTGVGKSTLLMAIQGVLSGGSEKGSIQLGDNGSRRGAALVLQNPDTQILTKSVGAEVAFGLENLGVAPEQMRPIVLKALRETGLDCSLGRDTKKLSMGQKYRLILSAMFVLQPRLLMVDEPSGQLDIDGLTKLKEILTKFKSLKMGILISEHRPDAFSDIVDVYWVFDQKKGTLGRVDKAPVRVLNALPGSHERTQQNAVISTRNLRKEGENGLIWSDVSLEIFPGEMVAVCGKNGSGKTTLMRCLIGAVKPDEGEIRIFGKNPTLKKLSGRVGYLFQDPCRQLFEDSVFEEVAFQLRRSGNQQWRERVNLALAKCGITELAHCSPHKLSYGQQHLVAIAMVIATEPALLLLDDPFTGLDSAIAEKILILLQRLRQGKNTTIIITSHHPEDGKIYDRQLFIQEGRVIEKKNT